MDANQNQLGLLQQLMQAIRGGQFGQGMGAGLTPGAGFAGFRVPQGGFDVNQGGADANRNLFELLRTYKHGLMGKMMDPRDRAAWQSVQGQGATPPQQAPPQAPPNPLGATGSPPPNWNPGPPRDPFNEPKVPFPMPGGPGPGQNPQGWVPHLQNWNPGGNVPYTPQRNPYGEPQIPLGGPTTPSGQLPPLHGWNPGGWQGGVPTGGNQTMPWNIHQQPPGFDVSRPTNPTPWASGTPQATSVGGGLPAIPGAPNKAPGATPPNMTPPKPQPAPNGYQPMPMPTPYPGGGGNGGGGTSQTPY